MKSILVFADGRTKEIESPACQWLEWGGAYFFGEEAYNREKPYRGCLVYLEVPKERYDARDRQARSGAERPS